MNFKNEYKCLSQNKFSNGEYKIIPIRFEDRIDIMKWRNEQIYHLRQDKPLTEKIQEKYFTQIVLKLFQEKKPNQLLFSFLKNEKLIGYGGLVHINWIDKNAEVSFIMNTQLEKENFKSHWITFLSLIEQIGLEKLKMHKLYIYAFDLRPHLYDVLESANYFKDAVLNQHCYFNKQYLDVVIYSKLKS